MLIVNQELIIIGDFNLQFDNPGRSEIKSLTSLISSYNLNFSINESTHKGGHILDNVIIRNDTKFAYSFSIRDLGLSDHYMIEVLLIY